MHVLYLIVVWMHILVAMVWVGGAAFIGLVLVPAIYKPEFAQFAPKILRAGALRFRSVGWISLAVLVVTGFFILGLRGYGFRECLRGDIFSGQFGHILAGKLTLVVVLLLISGLHDFYLGPRATETILNQPDSPEAAKSRKGAGWMGRIVVILSMVIVAMAVLLVRGL